MGSNVSPAWFSYFVRQVIQPLISADEAQFFFDDIIIYANTVKELKQRTTKLLQRLRLFNLKINPSKAVWIATSVTFCGKKYSRCGISVDPEKISALEKLPTPQNAADLIQAVCSINWFRDHLIKRNHGFTRCMQKLREIIATAFIGERDKKKSRVKKKSVKSCGWSDQHDAAWQELIDIVRNAVTLAVPKENYNLALITDASSLYWSACIVQYPEDQEHLELQNRSHEPLAMLSGAFDKTQRAWHVSCQEGYPIIQALGKLEYLLIGREFEIYTDHKSLEAIFSPDKTTFKKPALDRLQRWSLLMTEFVYSVKHIKGESNDLADWLSRSGNSAAQEHPPPSHQVFFTGRESEDEEEDDDSQSQLSDNPWRPPDDEGLFESADPLHRQIQQDQRDILEDEFSNEFCTVDSQRLEWNSAAQLYGRWKSQQFRIWVPPSQVKAVCLEAHRFGHRGVKATTEIIRKAYFWKRLRQDVQEFVSTCAICAATKGSKTLKRFLGQKDHAEFHGQIIYMDYLYIGKALNGPELLDKHYKERHQQMVTRKTKLLDQPRRRSQRRSIPTEKKLYEDTDTEEVVNHLPTPETSGIGDEFYRWLLVIKDDFSNFVDFTEVSTPNATETAAALIKWCGTFGCPEQICSDRGSHFKNSLVQEFTEAMDINHHFSLPWVHYNNGAVERVHVEIMKVLRALIISNRLDESVWTDFLPTVMGILNNIPSERNGGYAPIQLINPAAKPLTPCRVALSRITKSVPRVTLTTQIERSIQELRKAFDDVSASVTRAREAQDLSNRSRYPWMRPGRVDCYTSFLFSLFLGNVPTSYLAYS